MRTDPRPKQSEAMRRWWASRTPEQRSAKLAHLEPHLFNGSNRRYRVRPEAFARWDTESAYWLGFLFADGCIERADCVAGYSNDLDLILALDAYSMFDHRPPQQKGACFAWRAYGVDVVSRLRAFGIEPRKSLTLRWPMIPFGYIGPFVRGYFDGDGSIIKSKRWEAYSAQFTCGSESFLVSLKSSLALFGINSHIYPFPSGRGAKMQINQLASVRRLRDLMYADGGFCLERKRARFPLS
jgi:hypothetical protein